MKDKLSVTHHPTVLAFIHRTHRFRPEKERILGSDQTRPDLTDPIPPRQETFSHSAPERGPGFARKVKPTGTEGSRERDEGKEGPTLTSSCSILDHLRGRRVLIGT